MDTQEEYPHVPWCNGDRRFPAGVAGHSCCCLNYSATPKHDAQKPVIAVIERTLTADEVIRRLRKIHDDVQVKFHDQWDWMNADFFVECLQTLLNAAEAERDEARKRVAELEQQIARLVKAADAAKPFIMAGLELSVPAGYRALAQAFIDELDDARFRQAHHPAPRQRNEGGGK